MKHGFAANDFEKSRAQAAKIANGVQLSVLIAVRHAFALKCRGILGEAFAWRKV
jgi:hypothetical protein